MKKKIAAIAAAAVFAASLSVPAQAGNQQYCYDTDKQASMGDKVKNFWSWFFYGKCS